MVTLTRRQIGVSLAAAATALVVAPMVLRARARIVIVGGGAAGASVAGQLQRQGRGLRVTLIEPKTRYTTCFFSNYYIGGLRSFESITHDYSGLRNLGVEVVHQKAQSLDLDGKSVTLADGSVLAYDALVVAPGIAFKSGLIEGYDEAASMEMPHAWQAGAQTQILRNKLDALADGALVVIAPPKGTYRCPPGPYERACAIAHVLKTQKPKSKLIILDPKLSFAKQALFQEAFERHYKGIVELRLTNDIDDMQVARVDAKSGEVVTKSGERFSAGLANIIPEQKAGEIAQTAGLVEGDWCPVDLATMQSRKARGVYVIGDAAATPDMPKSAHSANSHARVVAENILAEFAGGVRSAAHYRNVCWSMLAPDDGVKIGADFAPGTGEAVGKLVPSGNFVSKTGEPEELRRATYAEGLAWYETLTKELFAKG